MATLTFEAIQGLSRPGPNCDFYEGERDYERGRLRRYNQLIFALICVVAITVVIAIATLFFSENYGVGIANGLATIVGGGAIKVIFTERKGCQDRIDLWVKALEEHCNGESGPPPPSSEGVHVGE